ncbi:unnamed protein product [Protopolystoma xenopodis]|uniref:RBR-type E3 ubiquitin transferase n=1 Tax=Protopolystoma xenopodis TaxID=117903 RepID=A0A448XB63_9PLAT|nr:unnamed protein product [Protopolystoma xenopodis]
MLSPDKLQQHMTDLIYEVAQIISVPEHTSTTLRLLLAHFKWDKDTLIDHYFGQNETATFAEAGLAPLILRETPGAPDCIGRGAVGGLSCPNSMASTPTMSSLGPIVTDFLPAFFHPRGLSRTEDQSTALTQRPPVPTSSLPFERIKRESFAKYVFVIRKVVFLFYYSPKNISEYLFLLPSFLIYSLHTEESNSLDCGHSYCPSCWQRYIVCKIMDENQGDRISCPTPNCEAILDDSIVFRFIQDQPIVRRRFQKLITNSFVAHNRALTWCPGTDCGYAVRSLGGPRARQAVCSNCNESFCFACGQPWHEPVLCDRLRQWLRRIEDDAGTSTWIVANTKECPKCRAVIEKNGGCNHMTCKNLNCKYDFCWVCLDRWEPHGSQWYNCNRYDETQAQKSRDAQTKSRAALQRYLFYFNRYANHKESLRFEAKLNDSVQRKMEEMQAQGMSWIDVKFIKQAVEVLCRCRRTLMYTYVFAFYLKDNNQTVIFESNQSDLEQSTEQLSEFLERDITSLGLNLIKQRVQDRARYCENRRRVLLDHVQEGYEQNTWEYRDC